MRYHTVCGQTVHTVMGYDVGRYRMRCYASVCYLRARMRAGSYTDRRSISHTVAYPTSVCPLRGSIPGCGIDGTLDQPGAVATLPGHPASGRVLIGCLHPGMLRLRGLTPYAVCDASS